MKYVGTMPRVSRVFSLRGKKELSPHLPGMARFQLAETLRLQWQRLLTLGLFGLGLFFGSKAEDDLTSGLAEIARGQQFAQTGQKGLFAGALSYFATDFLFLSAAFLFGLCAIGLPFVLFLPIIRGMGIGAISSWYYINYGAAGLGYGMLVLFPATIISMLAMLTYCKESMLMAGDMLLVAAKKSEQAEVNLRLFALRFAVLLIPCALASVVDAACHLMFAGLFSFA
ncbi:MAG: stage II sporulation protein M [Oscillospiraceae bacterium]|jgi:stage II sporulation protein M|nr:stage II sporulation protein M [Oscillospiraceae bacterium]